GLLRVDLRLGVAGPGFESGPAVGMVQAEMPRPGPAHGEASECDAARVDLVIPLGLGKRFEDIGLAGPPVRDVAAAVRLEVNIALLSGNGLDALVLADERHLVAVAVHTLQPHVEADGLAIVAFGNDEPVRLEAAVHARAEGADDAALRRRPRRRAGGQLLRP